MKAEELREKQGGFSLACCIYDDQILKSSLRDLSQAEMRILFYKTTRQDLKDEIKRLMK